MDLCSTGVSLKGTNSSGSPSRLMCADDDGGGDVALGCIPWLAMQICTSDSIPQVSMAQLLHTT